MTKKVKEKKKRGAELKLNDEIIESVATVLSNGLTRETAARIAKVSYQTFYEWRKRGREERERRAAGEEPRKGWEIYLKFLNQIEEAETDALITWQDTVNKAARADAAWAFKMLQLRDPQGYSQANINYTADINLDNLTNEQLERIAAGEDPASVIASGNPSESVIATQAKRNGKRPAPKPASQ